MFSRGWKDHSQQLKKNISVACLLAAKFVVNWLEEGDSGSAKP